MFWNKGKQWSKFVTIDRLETIFDKGPSESSLFYHNFMKKYYFIIINPYTDYIALRLADQLTGPWTEEIHIYQIPYPWNKSPVFAYAGKSHPELQQSENEIIVTFMSNAGLKDIETMTQVYIPQAIRVTITK